MSVSDIFVALSWIGILVVVAKWLHGRVRLFQTLYLPSSVIAGALALLVGPQVLGRIADAVGWGFIGSSGAVPEQVAEVWSALPGPLISIVFAALFLGKAIPGPRAIWQIAGPQVAFGQAMAWGQYVVGLLLAITVLTPVFGLPPAAGALIEISFEGGHGTAAALGDTFAAFGFAEGEDLAVGLATISLIAGVLVGTGFINWAARTGRIDPTAAARATGHTDDVEDISELDSREPAPATSTTGTDPLSVHIGFVSLAVAIGVAMQQGLVAVEDATYGGEGGLQLFAFLPLFPLAMLGGVAVQVGLDKTGRGHRVDRGLMNRISGVALDTLIVAALGTLSLDAIGANIGPFAVLAVAGLAWTIGSFVVLAPRMLPVHPWERGFADFGQSMGTTATGLLLMRMADPTNRSGGLESFGYKQLLFEPFLGGGLFTAAAIPLIVQLGPVPVLVGTSVMLVAWVALGMGYFMRRAPVVADSRPQAD